MKSVAINLDDDIANGLLNAAIDNAHSQLPQ